MKKIPTNQPLLDALLEPAGADAQREALLRQTLGAARRQRAVRRVGSLAALLAALVVIYRLSSPPSEAPEIATQRAAPSKRIAPWPSTTPAPAASMPLAITRALPTEMWVATRPGCTPIASPTQSSIALVTTRTDQYQVIDDAQLLALFRAQGAILIPSHNGVPARFMLASQAGEHP